MTDTASAPAVTGTPVAAGRPARPPGRAGRLARMLASRLSQLVLLLFAVSTLLFFLLRLTGDPATTLAGQDATPDQVEAVREQYGLDAPLAKQYATFILRAAQLDFGTSVQSGANALTEVLDRLPATLQLALLAVLLNMLVAIPFGAWIGSRSDGRAQSIASGVVFVGQGMPGYVIGLVLIQVFAVQLGLLPSIGNASASAAILPAVSLAAFLVPRLTRVVSANVAETMDEDFVRTARAAGASRHTVILRHVLPNALLGAAALVGTQLAILVSGALIIEVIFAWPGLGALMINSVQQLDFPIVQAAVFTIAGLVFLTNMATDALLGILDPRLRRQR
ncbi:MULTISPECIES: ABC transporter permease [Thermomonosporaceae]|uniref:ABC transporter permease n=1 Tax=Thermomonosporaceae TaxID=2012 RepID=UPI00255A77F9|nr:MULTISPECIES: ABC transporter permease [Thermomonosporaceae]MDL4774155.1 ABC transporter permease [Actinomadura xylanilytica]